MWYIILFYIGMFKLPVSANMFQVRSIADMTNIHRTKVMPTIVPQEPPLVPTHELTTCIHIAGKYEGGIYKNQERICNTIQRRPETKRQAMPTTRMLLYSRNLAQMPHRQQRPEPPRMIKPQVILPKQLEHNNLRYNHPQNVLSTPRQVKLRQYRASISAQRPVQDGKRQAVYHVNEGNREYQEYQLLPQAGRSDNRNRGQQEYQSLPAAAFGNNQNQQSYQQLQGAYNPNAESISQELFPKAYSTSTAAPIFNQAVVTNEQKEEPQTNPPKKPDVIPNPATKSTTSTMPPFPGGFLPPDDFSGEQSQVCNGKAKCNQYVWTTRRKHAKRTTEEFMLWTP